jgi:hypothetical protein
LRLAGELALAGDGVLGEGAERDLVHLVPHENLVTAEPTASTVPAASRSGTVPRSAEPKARRSS